MSAQILSASREILHLVSEFPCDDVSSSPQTNHNSKIAAILLSVEFKLPSDWFLTASGSGFTCSRQQTAPKWMCLYMSQTGSFLRPSVRKAVCSPPRRLGVRGGETAALTGSAGASGEIMTAPRAPVFQCGLFCRH